MQDITEGRACLDGDGCGIHKLAAKLASVAVDEGKHAHHRCMMTCKHLRRSLWWLS